MGSGSFLLWVSVFLVLAFDLFSIKDQFLLGYGIYFPEGSVVFTCLTFKKCFDEQKLFTFHDHQLPISMSVATFSIPNSQKNYIPKYRGIYFLKFPPHPVPIFSEV